jgi:hypothetical protein
LKEIATGEGIDNSYVSRMANLTTLAPDIVAAIWDEQRAWLMPTLVANVAIQPLDPSARNPWICNVVGCGLCGRVRSERGMARREWNMAGNDQFGRLAKSAGVRRNPHEYA